MKTKLKCRAQHLWALGIVLCLVAFGFSMSASPAVAKTSETVNAKMREINAKYEIGEAFSDEDAQYVRAHGKGIASLASRASAAAVYSGGNYGSTIYGSGNVYHNGVAPGYTYGANVRINTTGGATPRSIKFTVKCTSYGVIGQDGFGKIYEGSKSVVANGRSSLNASPQEGYSGVMALYYIDSWIDVTTANGDFYTVTSQ